MFSLHWSFPHYSSHDSQPTWSSQPGPSRFPNSLILVVRGWWTWLVCPYCSDGELDTQLHYSAPSLTWMLLPKSRIGILTIHYIRSPIPHYISTTGNIETVTLELQQHTPLPYSSSRYLVTLQCSALNWLLFHMMMIARSFMRTMMTTMVLITEWRRPE